MIRVAVSGALGRMGRLACETVKAAADLQYAGGFARTRVPEEHIDDNLERLLAEQKPDVLVDFTPRPATQDVARAALQNGVIPVIGSSEWNDRERADLGALCHALSLGALLVPNFAIGAVLMMRFAEEAAKFFPTIEIVELHRAEKRDKPSGTAAATAARIKSAGGPADVPIHSVRLQGLLAHQEVLCGGAGELLTIRHDSLSRESFAAGILFAIRNVAGLKGLHVGLDSVLA
jgi:4-hydroxy-tetrahydrodipicolinate reductase